MAKTQRTGYLVIDCKGQEIGETPITIPGVYNRMKKANKVCMLTNFVFEGVQGPILFTPLKEDSEYMGVFIETVGDSGPIVGMLTFSSDDKLTFVEVPTSSDIPGLYMHYVECQSKVIEVDGMAKYKFYISYFSRSSTPCATITDVLEQLANVETGTRYYPVSGTALLASVGSYRPISVSWTKSSGDYSSITVSGYYTPFGDDVTTELRTAEVELTKTVTDSVKEM